MKKIKGTKYAHIGTSYRPSLDRCLDELEASIIARQKRIDEMIARLRAELEKDN